MIKILFIGDISGSMGKLAVQLEVFELKKKYDIDYVIANAENTTKGRGLDRNDYQFLCDSGIDFFTMGNHTWHKKDIYDILVNSDNIIRPNNLKKDIQESKIGVGTKIINIKGKKFRITNLLGLSVSVKEWQTNPFLDMKDILDKKGDEDFHIVDFHSETTSEKNAFFLEFKGQVSAIIGTHTHVQTNDARVVDNTAYITDAGMTGASNGVIGAKPESIIAMFKEEQDFFRLEEQIGRYQFCAIIMTFDENENRVISIEPIYIYQDFEKYCKLEDK